LGRSFRNVCQVCQIVSFRTKNPNLGKFWRVLERKNLKYFRAFWNILWTFGIFYYHLVRFVFIWYIFSGFGIMYQQKSGNPDDCHVGRGEVFILQCCLGLGSSGTLRTLNLKYVWLAVCPFISRLDCYLIKN
jgi:hypothetical protein